MTTPAAAALYLAQHNLEHEGRRLVVFNPHCKFVKDLPVIYGFNNSGSSDWHQGLILSQDGAWLGSHICSHEGYMPSDLGCLEGTRPDRHAEFRKHYPNGYRMEFVPYASAGTHAGLAAAYALTEQGGEAKK